MNRIKEIRQARGMTLSEVAGLTGLSESGISRIERNERVPDEVTYIKIAQALRCEVDELKGEKEFSDEIQRPRYAQIPLESEGDRLLFKAWKKATEEDKLRAAAIIEALTKVD